jgi:hypothetical protein
VPRPNWIFEIWWEKRNRKMGKNGKNRMPEKSVASRFCHHEGKLKFRYGEKASAVKYAETFELSEYGRQPEVEELNELFPL